MRAIRRLTVRPLLPEALEGLAVLARNLRWSWHPETQDVFASVDGDLWAEVGGDPVRLLGEVGRDRLGELAADEGFTARLAQAVADLELYLTGDRWYQRREAQAGVRAGAQEEAQPGARNGPGPRGIGYFSPEFGITSVLPQYSGGLGILAGDHLKTASDLGVPITGVGLLYRSGYFRQSLSRDGWQQETYPVADPDGLPLTLLRHADGRPAMVGVGVPGGVLHARIWVAQVGRVPLLLLDSDVEANEGHLREVTDRLYGGGGEHRLLQELLLGVGGTRALGVHAEITGAPYPEVFHTNEGHAGFGGLERIRQLCESGDLSLDEALEVSRAGTVFTTHTPVPAGIDRFDVDLVRQYFGAGASGSEGPVPGLPVDWVLALGREDLDGGDPGMFNMAVMGFRLAQRANGVSELHGEVSRGMFNGLWRRFDVDEVPISSITNGVHAPTWVAREVLALAAGAGADVDPTGAGGAGAPSVFDVVDDVPAADLLRTKRELRQRLVADVRRRLRASWRQRGAADAELGWVDGVLDAGVLTIGFARRVPSYKRLTLMLRDPERLKRLLLHPERPVQLVIAGKSHPADDGGKRLIQQLVRFADDPEVRHRIVFLPDYDIAMAQPLYPGCDVWLNNPLRPYEACGTSGMKAALNGGLNLSILDGWWDEWYDGRNGWAIGSADGVDDPDLRDDLEAAALYDLVEHEVAPRFYGVDEDGVPEGWVAMVRHTLKSLGPKVLSTRMLRDYVDELYAPAAATVRLLDADPTAARTLAGWKADARAAWPGVAVEHVEAADLPDTPELGAPLSVRAFVALGSLRPDDVVVQLVHGGVSATDDLTDAVAEPLALAESYDGGRHRFEGTVTLDRTGPFGYTVRVLPRHDLLVSPAEMGLVALA